jgi:RimJ/RimL family protein N-acetyltransferase
MENNNVILLDFSNVHLSKTFAWISNPELQRDFLIRSQPTWETHCEYFSHLLSDKTQRVYAILKNGIHVGNCGLKNIFTKNKEAEYWIYIGDSAIRNQGIGERATIKICQIVFEQMEFERLYVHVASFNKAAIALYKKMNFIEAPIEKHEDVWRNRDCLIIHMELKK